MKRELIKNILFILFLIGVIIFLLWSRLVLISLILLFIIDSFTSQFSTRFLKKRMTSTGFTVLKYSYLILLPLLFAVFVRTFFFDIYFVPSSSMERTLFPNDYVLVNKVSYGTKIPKRVNDIPLIGNVIKSENKKFEYNLFKPLKGYLSFAKNDIIVLKAPDNNTKFYIKRIIGNPGENFEILAGEVSINHDKLIKKEQYVYKYFTQKNKDSLFFLSVEEYNNLKKNDIIKYVENDCKKRQDNTTLGGKK